MLRAIRITHTAIWGVMAGSIVALPIIAIRKHFDWALAITFLVLIEILVLAMNRSRCPLTDLAARYTAERGDNFDIYLPRWIARHNKRIFGALFLAGEIVTLWCWLCTPVGPL